MSESKKYILVVDDEASIVRLISSYLAGDGYRAECALSGEEALKKLQNEKPGLVLLDIRLGDMNGIDLLKQIKKIDVNIPVVMVTGLYDNDEGQKAFDAGAIDYVTKPIDFKYLQSIIQVQML